MKLDRQIVRKQRRYETTLPKEILLAMGWIKGKDDDKVEIVLDFDPSKNTITLTPKKSNPRGILGFYLALQQIRESKNKKKWQRLIERNLSPEARRIKHDLNIWGDPNTTFFEENELNCAREALNKLKNDHKGLENTDYVKEWIKDAEKRVKYYEKKLKLTAQYLENKKIKKKHKLQEVNKKKS